MQHRPEATTIHCRNIDICIAHPSHTVLEKNLKVQNEPYHIPSYIYTGTMRIMFI
jgi:hypothetical protein